MGSLIWQIGAIRVSGSCTSSARLVVAEIRRLLAQPWVPSGVKLPPQPWADDAIAAIIRITSGNFRLFKRLLTQIKRILEISGIQEITKTFVETARETVVIGVA